MEEEFQGPFRIILRANFTAAFFLFHASSTASFTESCLSGIKTSLKDLFTLHKLADKVVLVTVCNF